MQAVLALTCLEAWIFLVDHEGFTVATDNLGARFLLQRPKRLADLHRALLSVRGYYTAVDNIYRQSPQYGDHNTS